MRPEFIARFNADDWGLSPAVNDAILELARTGLLRSVSLFANLPFLNHGLQQLERTGVEFSAHLNFTLGRSLMGNCLSLTGRDRVFRPFGAFLVRGLMGLVDAEEVRLEAEAQLRLLCSRCSIMAVNGHQHVHLLPWMVKPVAQAAQKAGIRRLRMMDDPAHLPSRIASVLVRGRFKRIWPEVELELSHYLWPTGHWDSAVLERKLAYAGTRGLLVHPSVADDFSTLEFCDSLTSARVREYEFLRSLT